MGMIQGFAFALFYTFFGLPIGWAADRMSRKWLLTAGTALWSLMTAGAGLVRSFGGLFMTRAGVGVGEATINPCTTSLVSDYFRPETRPKAFGVFTMSTALGTIVTYLGGGAILAFVGLVGTGGGVFHMPLHRPDPGLAGGVHHHRRRGPRPGAADGPDGARAAAARLRARDRDSARAGPTPGRSASRTSPRSPASTSAWPSSWARSTAG